MSALVTAIASLGPFGVGAPEPVFMLRDVNDSIDDAKALINLVRLKEKDEYTYLHSVAVAALMINYPQLNVQKERILAHSGNAMTVVLLVFAAGIFAGIFSGTKMVDALAQTLVDWIPDAWSHWFPLVVALTSMPLTFVLSNDAYYFGVVPILANAAAAYGIDPVEIARASVLGQPVHLMSPLVASTLLLVGMVDRDIGDFQKATVKWAVLTSLVITALALLTGALSFFV